MILKKIILYVFYLIFYLSGTRECYGEAIIVDHTCTNLSLIPDTAISSAAAVRSMMRHCSILQQLGNMPSYASGLDLLKKADPKYDRTNFKFSSRGHPGGEKIIDDFYDDDVSTTTQGSYVDHNYTKYDIFATYVYVTEGWWGLSAMDSTMDWVRNWTYYRDQSLKIEAKYPDKKFVWCTTSLNANYFTQQVYDVHYAGIAYFNDSMRAFCRENGKILYDLADILCHDPQGNLITKGQRNGKNYECLFTSSPVEFEQFGYATLADRIHPNTDLGRLQLARAYWWLIARIAGWPGPSTSIPAAASLLQVTSTGYTDIGLRWKDNSTDEDGFNLYRSEDSISFAKIKTVSSMSGSGSLVSYTDTGLESGTKYWYHVKAANYLGESSPTATQAATTLVLSTVPNAPSNLAISRRNIYSIELTWTDNSANEERFKLYRSTDGSHFIPALTLAQGAQSCTNEGLLPDTTYWYYVTAGNAVGESSASNTRSGFTLSAAQELVGNYRFDDPNEILQTTAFDSSGYGHNGAILGNPVLSSDSAKGDNSLLLDGVNDYVNVIGSNLLSPRQRITLSTWIKIPSVSSGCFISREGSYFLQAANASDNLPTAEIIIQGQPYILKCPQLQLNKWHHIALTYDYISSALLFYLDGSMVSSVTASGIIDDSDTDLYFGKKAYSYFKGKIDDVRIYSYALDSVQVRALYREGTGNGVQLTSVQATATTNGVTITWETDKPASSRVEYGFSAPDYGRLTIEDSSLVTSHSVTITDLMSDREYHYRVISKDSDDGNQSTSPDYVFSPLSILNEITDINVYPNPHSFANNAPVKFKVGGTGGEAKIFTLSGQLVRELRVESGTDEIHWDGKNEKEEKVNRGVYIYILTSGSGDKIKGKLAVKN